MLHNISHAGFLCSVTWTISLQRCYTNRTNEKQQLEQSYFSGGIDHEYSDRRDSFKGSCSAREVTDTIERAANTVLPNVTVTKIPVADGGEGTVDALVAAMNGTKVCVPVHDPLGRPITAEYGLLPDGSAVLETAAASGLTLLKLDERDALHASTFGTGELIRHALEHGVKRSF